MRALGSPSLSIPMAAWGILAVALLIRIAVAVTSGFEPGGDSADYDRHATAIAATGSYPESGVMAGGGPTAFRPPAYPFLLGLVYAVSADSWTAGLLAQALLGTGVVAMVGVVATLAWGQRPALWAMGAAAVYPPLLVVGSSLLSEPLFLVFELAAIAAAIQHRRAGDGWRWAAAAGVLIGLATLTRVNGVLLAPVLAAYIWGRPWTSRRTLVPVATLLAALALTLSPWALRNALVLDAFVPFSTQGEFALARNFNELARDDPKVPSAPHNPEWALAIVEDPELSEVEAAGRLGERAREFMRDNPGYVLETVARNAARMGHLTDVFIAEEAGDREGVDAWLTDAGIWAFYPSALLALIGAFTPLARRLPWSVWMGPLLVVAPTLLMAAGRTRYRAPIDPVIAMLAGVALLAAWDRVRARFGPARAPDPPR